MTVPNILFIVVDEESHWDLYERLVPASLLSAFRDKTAGRMLLRNHGVRFANYYTPGAPCSPARGTLYTGHHAADTQLVDNVDFSFQPELSTEIPTLGDILKDAAGYRCVYKGKVHFAADDFYQGTLEPYGFYEWEGTTTSDPPEDKEGSQGGYRLDPTIAAQAVKWLQGKTAQSPAWLLTVNFINPHDVMLVDVDGGGAAGRVQQMQGDITAGAFPLLPIPKPGATDDASTWIYSYWWSPVAPPNFPAGKETGARPGAVDELASTLSAVFGNIPCESTAKVTVATIDPLTGAQGSVTAPLWQVYLNYFLNCIADNDRSLLSVLNALRSRPLVAANTIVVFTADHGEMAMSHAGLSRYFDAASKTSYQTSIDPSKARLLPLRQKGSLVYDENCRLPLVVANLSGSAKAAVTKLVPTWDAGVDVRALASSVDLVPTLMAWAGWSKSQYSAAYGAKLSAGDASRPPMRSSPPGVSLVPVIAAPATYAKTVKWAASGGRDAVLLTGDSLSTADADKGYNVVWGHDYVADLGKRSALRGYFDGRYKYARYFSPLAYATATAATSDLQVFDRDNDAAELHNLAAEVDVAAHEQTLKALMTAELHDPARTPTVVSAAIAAQA